MTYSVLPKIGDIITFSPVWQISLEAKDNDRFPCGIITDISTYKLLSAKYDNDLIGTLAYPMTIDVNFFENASVFVVQWSSVNPNIVCSYRLINEEWFYNNSFVIVSRS